MNLPREHIGMCDSVKGLGHVVSWKNTFPEEVWNEVVPLLAPALEYADCEFDMRDVYGWCRVRKAHLWVYYEDSTAVLAMVTMFHEYPKAKHLYVMMVGGAKLGRALKAGHDALQKFMQFNDCTKLIATVRPQFAKVLSRYGFGDLYRVVGKTMMEKPHAQMH